MVPQGTHPSLRTVHGGITSQAGNGGSCSWGIRLSGGSSTRVFPTALALLPKCHCLPGPAGQLRLMISCQGYSTQPSPVSTAPSGVAASLLKPPWGSIFSTPGKPLPLGPALEASILSAPATTTHPGGLDAPSAGLPFPPGGGGLLHNPGLVPRTSTQASLLLSIAASPGTSGSSCPATPLLLLVV